MYRICLHSHNSKCKNSSTLEIERSTYFALPEIPDELFVKRDFDEKAGDGNFTEHRKCGSQAIIKLHPGLSCDGLYLVWIEEERVWVAFEYSVKVWDDNIIHQFGDLYRVSNYASCILRNHYSMTQELELVYTTPPYAG